MGRKWDATLIFFKSKTILLLSSLPIFVLVYKKQKFRPGTLVTGKRGGICCKILDISFRIAKLSIIKYRKLCWGRQKWDDVFNGDLFQLRNTEI